MQSTLLRIEELLAAEIGQPPGFFHTRFGQSFAVLTVWRMLQTLQIGRIESKPAGAQWARENLDAAWTALSQQAWDEREGVRFCVKIRQPAEAELPQEALRFLRYGRRV